MTKILKFQTAKPPRWRIEVPEIAAVGLALMGGVGFCAHGLIPTTASGENIARQFSICNGPARVTCVVDGEAAPAVMSFALQ